MEYKTVQGITLPVLSFGTGAMGHNYSIDPVRDSARIQAIQCAIENGITHIDTAERYGGGRAEELIAEAIKGVDRKKLFITSKVLPEHLKYNDVVKSAHASAKRLQTFIDLYLIHKPNPDIPLEETMRAMDALVEEGCISYVGVSNFSSSKALDEAQKCASHKLLANEVEYSLLARNKAPDCENMESETIPYCQRHGLFVLAYKALARGQLARSGNSVLDSIAQKYNKTPAQVALNWLFHQENVIAITQAIDEAHLKDSLGALGWKLEEADSMILTKEMKRD